MKKIFNVNNREKKAVVAVLISDKTDHKANKVNRDKEGHCIMTKESVQKENVTIINIYASYIEAPIYVKQKKINRIKEGNRL